MSDTTFAARLARHAQSTPNGTAVVDGERRLTHAQLQQQVQALAGGLQRLGVQRGDRVALWLPNCAEWVVAFLACAHLGALVLAVNTRFRAAEAGDLLGRGGARWLLYWPGFKGIAFDSILAEVPAQQLAGLQACITVGDEAAVPATGALSRLPRPALHTLATSDEPAPPPAPNDGVLCFTTSGTTALPKLVLHDQATLLAHGDAVARVLAYDDSTCVLASAPFCGAFGFATLVGALAAGRPIVCDPVFDAQRAVQAVRQHRVTHTFANNEALVQMLHAAGPRDLASARLFGFASFAPGDTLVTLAQARGLPIAGLYGSSELIALAAVQPVHPEQGDTSARHLPGGSLVHPQARVRARHPDSGTLLPHGQAGEIEILSPSLMRGYLGDEAATALALTADGYFRTGDLGHTLSERQFVFHSRLGDALRLAGFLVNPAEIEAVVEALPGVRACQVVGAQMDGKLLPYAFVIADDTVPADAAAQAAAWQAACRRTMAGFKVPVAFEVVQEFPSVVSANSVKILRNRLREMAEAALRRAPSPNP